MPELPEVEVVARELRALFEKPRQVEKLELKRWTLRDPIPRDLPERIEGQKIWGVSRRAKYLLLNTSNGSLLSHLGMTGSWRVRAPGETLAHDHAYLHLHHGPTLAFRDPRRFGVLDWVEKDGRSPRFAHLGPEPLEKEFTPEYLWHVFRGRKIAVKAAIMNQEIVVGVGNIYASEALFRAGVRPRRPCGRVTRGEIERLVPAIQEVLKEAIDQGGSTIRDYTHADGASGQFQSRFAVYNRKHLDCMKCGCAVRHAVLGGRSTYWCSSCQR